MIIGTGIDVLEISRMRKALERHGSFFLNHVFTAAEQAEAPSGRASFAYYAGRWAAKEAVSKALGTGIGKFCSWLDINIRRDEAGRPLVELTGSGAETARGLGITRMHISISHEGRLACASAIAE